MSLIFDVRQGGEILITNWTVREFISETASVAAVPGGGSVSALSGAQGAALLAMYCRLTIGRKKYSSVEGIMEKTLNEADGILEELLKLIDADTQAFEAVLVARKLPRNTEDEIKKRDQAIQEAFKKASLTPLAVARHCLRLLQLIEQVCGLGNKGAITDIGVANLQAYTALVGASYNVLINLPSITNEGFTSNCRQELQDLSRQGTDIYHSIFNAIDQRVPVR